MDKLHYVGLSYEMEFYEELYSS